MLNKPFIVSKMKNSLLLFAALLMVCGGLTAQSTPKRPLKPSDVYRLQTLGDPHISPDGKWVAYTLSSVDSAKNKRNTDLWMQSWDGKESIQLTFSPDGESQPRWSPDGKYLSFTSSRNGLTGSQIWLMDRRGGEARVLTDLKKGDLSDYEWSPDGKKIALVISSLPDTSKSKTPKPIVIDRFRFKQDVEGYLTQKTTHLYLYDVASKKLDTLTKGKYNESSPKWSPDGTQIAFVSNRTADPDRNGNTDIWVIDAKPNAVMKQITTWTGRDSGPEWSPDGKQLAYVRSTSSENYFMYDQSVLCVVAKDGGEPKLLSLALDRPVSSPLWTNDGKALHALVSDDRTRYVAQFTVADGKMTKTLTGNQSIATLERHPSGSLLAVMSNPQTPAELYAAEAGGLRRLTKHQEAFLAPLALATVEGFTSKSKDGATVSNLLYRPANAVPGAKLPTILFIHGGPVAQDEFSFDLSRQMLSAAGYAVAGVNYRGSNGRGLAYSKVISADWGNKEVLDILGATDYLVQNGIADPEKLGIGGWSYGGILTNYTIATDTRFKAASSGAGVAMISSLYGVDQYIMQYENELGSPWKNFDKYVALSYPFLKADRIKTPTQFMVGESDFNVPSVGSEQMYQALRSLGTPTELIIYPGQFHGITNPAFQIDRFERYIKWFNRYLK
ncbi:peptidase S9 prolyl oligopeptidase active site domain protein [Runella slithyformis DSM 19594]|uniref:Acyl-peptide hydrolase n=2 Tax=Runella TaxID=105 RepID=A0A7U3ZNS0_RUNSL|nr:peptidase S9 prolyl oligopeptidase active site domain protein [Runella slithyformis DSM 19594]